MAFELVAARLLAPSLGTSMYVWTSVIGTMIAALALGYWLGGRLADARHHTSDIAWLLLLSGLAITVTLALTALILELVTRNIGDPRLQGVVAALLLFAPTSLVLGMISPYLVKQALKSLDNSGSTVATLGALNSLGGITGTFATGFVLFDFVGSRTTLIVLTILVIALSWLLVPKQDWIRRVAATVGIIILLGMYLPQNANADIVVQLDTSTPHYDIRDINYHGILSRGILMGPYGLQSGVSKDSPDDLLFTYTKNLARVTAAAPSHQHILILGGGGYTLPEYLGRLYSSSTVDVVEIDPKLEQIATKYLDYEALPNVRSFGTDARRFVAQANPEQYDIVIVDVYSDYSVPFSLTTVEYAAELSRIVKPSGNVLVNVIGNTKTCRPYLAAIHQSYTSALRHSKYLPSSHPDPQIYQNFIGIYSRQALDWTANVNGVIEPDLSNGTRLTDDFAPTEKLMQQCLNSAMRRR